MDTTQLKPGAPPERRQAADNGEIELMDHSETVEWLAKHPEVLSGFVDEWAAMVGHEVVGHARSAFDAFEAAKARGYDDPLLVPVWSPETIFFDE